MPRTPPDLFEGQRTRPWRPEEFALLEGRPCIYEIRPGTDELQLRLPGGWRLTASDVYRAGLSLKLPRVLRREIAIDGGEVLG